MTRYPILTVFLTILSAALAMGVPFGLEEAHSHSAPAAVPYRYVVNDLGTFGGPHSFTNDDSVVLNNSGVVAGGADTAAPDPTCSDDPFCFVTHAFRWQSGKLTDLGTLPYGVNSFAIAINREGAVAGVSENGLIDSATGGTIFHAVLWQNGHIHDLDTFGGSFSLPNDLNDFGQAVGGAQNLIPDPFNFGDIVGLPSSTQWRATLWHNGKKFDLGNLEKGHDAFAEFINEQEQIAGDAFTNSVVNATTGHPTVAPFLWENGKMRNLGTLGGHLGVVIALNNRGQVAGQSNLAGDAVVHPFLWEDGVLRDLGSLGGSISVPHWMSESGIVAGESLTSGDELDRPFVWKNGVMTMLGSLEDDPCSFALGVNSRGQVVGNSVTDCFDAFRPWIWEGSGPIIDLNDLVPPHPGYHLRKANFINERGEISGLVDYPNGDRHAMLLIPCDQVKGAPAGCQPSAQAVLAASGGSRGNSSSASLSVHPAEILQVDPEAIHRHAESLRTGKTRRRFQQDHTAR